MLLSLIGHRQREQGEPVHQSYCICGALKPENAKVGRGASLQTNGRSSGFSLGMVGKREDDRFRQ
jgi:hypothetical protein